MARKGNQQKNGLGGSTSSHKKGGLQSGSTMPNKKQKGSLGNTKDAKGEEYSSDAQPSVFVVDASQKPNHLKEDKKKTGDRGNVKIQGTAGAEQSEPCDSTSQDYTSTTGEEDKWASKNRKFESVELPETVGVRYLKTFVSSVSKASTEWLHKHRPLLDILVTKILTSRDYVRMKVKHAYPIVLKWLSHFMSILLVLSMVWLDCTLRGIDSVIRMGTTSFLTVIWCSIFSAVAMIGMLKFITVGAIVVLVALFVGFTLGLLLLVVSGIVFLWLYGSFWTTLTVLAIAGMSFTFSHERLALLILTLYSLYSAWTLVGWLGLIFALNLSFFSSDALVYLLRNNMNEHRRANSVPEQPAGMQSGPGEEEHNDGGSHPPADRGSGVPSTSGSDSEDEVVRLLNSADHYSALGLSRFQEIDVTFLKREYRKKAMLVHPDKNMGNEKAAEAFKKLQNAYEVLLDTSKQKAYDDELRREDLLNYFRRFQNTTPKNKRDGFFGRSEVHVDDPLGESRRIACQKCGSFHMWFYSKKIKARARSCQDCKDFHPAKDGDGWVEQSSQPFLFGIFHKVDTPRAYVCADSKIYDATEWYLCQGMRCPTNTHKPSFHVNTSVMSKHSYSKGGSSSHRGGGGGGGMPNMDETMTEEEFMEWLQNAVQSGMFDNFAAANGGSPSKNGSSSSSSSKQRKKKGKKW
ncbi:putative DnaJ domain, cleavage inducing molecular chaperone, Jiv, Chaperone J-domain superfamily [Helianthus anomalus]